MRASKCKRGPESEGEAIDVNLSRCRWYLSSGLMREKHAQQHIKRESEKCLAAKLLAEFSNLRPP